MTHASKRSFRNFLLNPLLQFRFGLYMIINLIVFSLIVGTFAYFYLYSLVDFLAEISEVPDTIKELIVIEIKNFGIYFGAILFIFFLLSTIFIVIKTHRIVGAEYAINRFIKEYLVNLHFGQAISLRKYDFLKDIATNLNTLSLKLKDSCHDKKM